MTTKAKIEDTFVFYLMQIFMLFLQLELHTNYTELNKKKQKKQTIKSSKNKSEAYKFGS